MNIDEIQANSLDTTAPIKTSYQILITGITWNPNSCRSYYNTKDYEGDLPEQFTLDVPENKLNEANKKKNNFNDVIETYVYEFLTRKFNHEVYHCQIWLPLED